MKPLNLEGSTILYLPLLLQLQLMLTVALQLTVQHQQLLRVLRLQLVLPQLQLRRSGRFVI